MVELTWEVFTEKIVPAVLFYLLELAFVVLAICVLSDMLSTRHDEIIGLTAIGQYPDLARLDRG